MGDLSRISRRALLRAGLVTAGGLLLPRPALAASGNTASAPLVDPHQGSLSMCFPARAGRYGRISDNFHGPRPGRVWASNHRRSTSLRAHDGGDVYPPTPTDLPPLFAPFPGVVCAVCVFEGVRPVYEVSSFAKPRQDYSLVIDGRVPRHGHHVWLTSTAPESAGYFVLYSHLQDESTIRGLLESLRQANSRGQALAVDEYTQVGVLGDSGNAVGTPMLHLELHYPEGANYSCWCCRPDTGMLTAINPHASLIEARVLAPESTPPTPAPSALSFALSAARMEQYFERTTALLE